MPGTTPRGYPFPLYTEANNFPTQLGAFATAVDTDVQTNLVTAVNTGLNAPACRVSSTVSQSVPNTGVDTIMTFVTEEYDNASFFTVGTSNTNIVIPSTGLYMVSCSIIYTVTAGASSAREILVKINGSFSFGKTIVAPTYDNVQIPTTMLISCNAADIVTLWARHRYTGGAINVTDKRLSINRITVP